MLGKFLADFAQAQQGNFDNMTHGPTPRISYGGKMNCSFTYRLICPNPSVLSLKQQ
jgi:hypothetical protein